MLKLKEIKMTVQELIDELQKIENKFLPVCLIQEEEFRYSEYTVDIDRIPVNLMSITFRKGLEDKGLSRYTQGLERKDRIELERC